MKLRLRETASLLLVVALFACSSENPKAEGSTQETETATEEAPTDDGKGVGPITSIEIGDAIDASLAATGNETFDNMCTSCHKMDVRHVGPPLAGVTERRKPEWIMNMILNPNEMVQKDPAARQLLAEYIAPMANQNLTEDEARSILEYFREYDANN